MTSRLKHKLELDNVNLNSAYLNESFVMVSISPLCRSRADLPISRSAHRFQHSPKRGRISSSMCRNGIKRWGIIHSSHRR